MTTTKRSQNKCKKCEYTWYPRGKNISLTCPSCGSSEVGFAGTGIGAGIGVIALIVIAVMVFGGNKKEKPTEASPAVPAVTEVPAPVDHQTIQFEPASEQLTKPTNIGDTPNRAEQVDEKVQTAPATSECAADNDGKPIECSTADCTGSAMDSSKCESKRAPKNELY